MNNLGDEATKLLKLKKKLKTSSNSDTSVEMYMSYK